jgi:hypothetical protein
MLHIIQQSDVDRWLIELEKAGVVQFYEHEGRPYGAFCNWHKHQRLYNHSSRFPEPPGESGKLQDSPGVSCELPPRRSRVRVELETERSRSKTLTQKPREPRARKPRALSVCPYSEDFEVFWKAYPRRVGKGSAWKSWQRVNGHGAAIMAALEWQTKSEFHLMKPEQYIPHPSTWLNQNRWDDEAPDPNKEPW